MLSVDDLTIEFDTPQGTLRAVAGVSFTLADGEILGIVGESGSGKSVTVQAIMGLLPSPPARVTRGTVTVDGRDLLRLNKREWRRIRGREMAMVFQEPVGSLNPVMRVGSQIVEAIRAHDRKVSMAGAVEKAVGLLASVGIPNPQERVREYPHQFSGGMAQRVSVAMAIANEPRILIADEPTTALDVTVQAQVMRTLRDAQQRLNSSMILITHDLGLVADVVDRVLVMYAGRVVEVGPIDQVFAKPQHPYTSGLLRSIPRLGSRVDRLAAIPGQPPSLLDPPQGCVFHPRCEVGRGRDACGSEPPLEAVGDHHEAACHFSEESELVEMNDGRAP